MIAISILSFAVAVAAIIYAGATGQSWPVSFAICMVVAGVLAGVVAAGEERS